MSLIPCPECKKEVSSAAEKCPHCGHTLKQKQSMGGIAAAVFVGLALGLLLLKGCGYI